MALYNEYFYHKTIFKSVATFGTLFNDITVKRKTSDGNTVKELKVPLSYGPRSKFLSKIEEADNIVKILFLSSKKNGVIGLISSTLKYPGLLVPFEIQLRKILFPT